MKVLLLTTHPNLPSSRFRVYQFLDYLHKEEVACDVFPVMPVNLYDRFYSSRNVAGKITFQGIELACRIRHIFSAGNYDVVVIQKNLMSVNLRFMSTLLRGIKTNIVFDFDDAIYLNTGQRLPAYLRFFEDTEQAKKIIKKSKIVIAGNDSLKNYALRFNARVRVIPTAVDTDYFSLKKNLLSYRHCEPSTVRCWAKQSHRVSSEIASSPRPFGVSQKGGTPRNDAKKDKLTLLWTGSYNSNRHINLLGPAISALSKEYDLKLLIISNMKRFIDFSIFGNAEVLFKEWSLEREVEDLHRADIGLVPLDNSEFTRGKCGLKILMFMSCGIPVVASPVGVNAKIVEEGKNGFLANSEKDWIDKLSALIEDEGLRNRMGRVGREKVKKYYSLRVNAPRLKEALEEAAG